LAALVGRGWADLRFFGRVVADMSMGVSGRFDPFTVARLAGCFFWWRAAKARGGVARGAIEPTEALREQ